LGSHEVLYNDKINNWLKLTIANFAQQVSSCSLVEYTHAIHTMNSNKTVPNRKFRITTTLMMPFVLQVVANISLVGYFSLKIEQKIINDLTNELLILLCLTITTLAILNGILTTRSVAHLIFRITKASEEIATGNLDKLVDVTDFIKIKEIDILEHSFNSMARQVKESFDALRKSEERFRSLVANIPGAIYRCQCNSDWTMDYISDAIETISGYSAADFMENRIRTYSSIIHSDDRDLFEIILNHGIATQEPYLLDYRVLHRDGSIRWVYEQGQPVFDDDQNPLYLDGAIFDITNRKKAEEDLRIAEENYRSIFENALEGIFQSLPEGRFINVNPALAKIYGYDSPIEMIKNITNITEQLYVDPEEGEEFRNLLEKQGIIKDFEYRCYCKDSSIIWIQIDARVVKDSEENVLYYEGIVQDISERKQRENELKRQLEELKIEIDHKKREKEVALVTQSDYFQEVQREIGEVNLDEFWS